MLHAAGYTIKYKWSGGITTLRNGSPSEMLAVVVFADLKEEPDLIERATSIIKLLRALKISSGNRKRNVIRLLAEHERLRRGPPGLGDDLPPRGLDASFIRNHEPKLIGNLKVIENDVARLAGRLTFNVDLERALILAMPDLTDEGFNDSRGNSYFAASRRHLLDAMVRGCRNGDGSPRRRPGGAPHDGRDADNEIQKRVNTAIEQLTEDQRKALLGARDANPHLLCTIALIAAATLDVPDTIVGDASEWLAERVVDRYFDDAPDAAQRLGVYAGGLVIAQVIGKALGIDPLHTSAQVARVIARALCPSPVDHPQIAVSTCDYFKAELEASAVNKLFGWVDTLVADGSRV